MVEQIVEQQNQNKGENSSYIEKITTRIIDNLELTIKNIHIRFENTEKNYQYGITLDQINAFTTDEEWNKIFVDRTNQDNKLANRNKLIKINNLGVYWN